MKIFTIGDLHLSLGSDKPMDVFGGSWQGYVEKLEKNWRALVEPEDIVVLAGDLSWGMSLTESLPDFLWLNALPGIKLIVKGNHDYWWGTVSKMEQFFENNGIVNFHFLHNTAYQVGEVALCGSRGWFLEGQDPSQQNQKILNRELLRLTASLEAGRKLGAKRLIAFLHYPPIYDVYRCDEFLEVLKEYEVETCYFGHLHGAAHKKAAPRTVDGIRFELISADYLQFVPKLALKSEGK